MAFQKGINELEGTLGNISFFTSNGNLVARRKRPSDKKEFLTHKSKIRRREAATEFGIASNASKFIKRMFHNLLWSKADHTLNGRLTSILAKILRSDPINPKNFRIISNGDLQLLKGFEFNSNGPFSQLCKFPYNMLVDRTAATINIQVPPFNPSVMLSIPQGASHFKIITTIGEIIMESGNSINDYNESTFQNLNNSITDNFHMNYNIKRDAKHTILIALAIRYYQSVNEQFVPLENKYFMPTVIAEINKLS